MRAGAVRTSRSARSGAAATLKCGSANPYERVMCSPGKAATVRDMLRNVATNVREAVIPGAGHWLMEESPTVTTGVIRDFLNDRTTTAAVKR
jgi:pimeloyl-ACP methyl ester carboxylesterase